MPSGTGSKVIRDPRGGRPGRASVIARPQKKEKEELLSVDYSSGSTL